MAAQDFRVKNGLIVADDTSIGGSITTVDSVQLDTAAGITVSSAGNVAWDSDHETLAVGLNGNVNALIGQSSLFYVKATTTITKGMVLYASGAVGASGKIEASPYIANNTIDERYIIGIAAEDISTGNFGFVMALGSMRQLQTDGQNLTTPETWNDGDVLYPSPTVAGELTKTKPTAPNQAVAIAFVTNAASNGSLAVRATELGWHVGELHDVHAPSPTDGQALTWVNANSRWEAVTPAPGYTDADADARIAAADLGDLGDVDLSTPQTDGQTILWDAGTSTWVPGNNETVTSLTAAGNILTYVNEAGTNQTIDLSLYLDDTNLARLVSGTVNGSTGIATFTRDDATTFTVDFSALFDDTNLARITSGSVSGNTMTLTRSDSSTISVDVSSLLDDTNLVTSVNGQTGAVTVNEYTDGDADARIAAASIGDLSDVDLTTPATDGQALVWDNANSAFKPGDVTADFLGLTDTPSSFGTAGQAVIVNSGATGLEFGDVTADFIGLTDSPSSYSGAGDRIVKVNSGATGIEFGDYVTGSNVRETYTGDGTSTDFTTTATFAGQNDLLVFVDGVIQYPGVDFTLSGTTLTFLSAPQNGAEILLYGLTSITSVVTPGDGTVTAAKLAASAYTRDTFNGDNSTTSFTLTRDPGSVYSPFIYVDGVIQDPITHYSITGTTLTFVTAPATGTDNVLVIYGPTNVAATVSDGSITHAKLAPSNFDYQVETGDGTTTDFTLDQQTSQAQNIIVTVAGVPQAPDGVPYSITNNGNTLSFTSAPSNGAKIVIRWYAVTTTVVPGNDTITTAMIQDGAITSDKIATGGVATVDMADGSVTSLKIANGGIATVDIADSAVTPQKLDREYATKGTSIALSIALG